VSNRLRNRSTFVALLCAAIAVAAPAGADAATSSSTGGSAYVPPPPPAKRAKIVNGVAIPPKGAPARVKNAIAAANRIIRKPYVYGGGHTTYEKGVRAQSASLERGYDCSGTVSFALYGGRFLRSPLDSSSFMSWGRRGKGRWITVYTNPGHAYMVIAGLRLDTSGGDRVTAQERRSGSGPRWRKYSRKPSGFRARHPKNF
jgi:hypothetical protein